MEQQAQLLVRRVEGKENTRRSCCRGKRVKRFAKLRGRDVLGLRHCVSSGWAELADGVGEAKVSQTGRAGGLEWRFAKKLGFGWIFGCVESMSYGADFASRGVWREGQEVCEGADFLYVIHYVLVGGIDDFGMAVSTRESGAVCESRECGG